MFFAAGCLTVRLPEATVSYPSAASSVLSWSQAVRETLEQHPDLIQARQEVQSRARSRDSAAGDFLPTVDASYDRDRVRAVAAGPAQDSMAFDIDASQPLFAGFRILGDFMKARRELQAEEYAYLETSADVRFRLRSVYIELERLEKLLEVNRRIAERRRQNAELIRLRYEAGREHLGSNLRAQAISGQAAFEVRQAERRIQSQSVLLSRELGGNFGEPVRVGGDMEKEIPQLPAAAPDYGDLSEQTPQVRRLLKTAESLKAAVVSAQSVLWPQVDGTYNYGYSGTRAADLRDSASVGFKVSVPFFHGGKNIQAVRKARADYKAAREAAKSARDARIASLADAWVLLADAIEQVEVRRRFKEAAQERAEIIRSQYTTGLVNFQDFDIAEQDLADSEKAYVQALANALTQQANWESVQGKTLEEAAHEAQI